MGLTTLQPLAYAVAYVTFFFGVISTVLRFYCRQYVLKIWGWDDYIAVAILVRQLRPTVGHETGTYFHVKGSGHFATSCLAHVLVLGMRTVSGDTLLIRLLNTD